MDVDVDMKLDMDMDMDMEVHIARKLAGWARYLSLLARARRPTSPAAASLCASSAACLAACSQ
jgi:hypothetical protein